MIVIVDYGMGNLRSVQKGFEKVGYEAFITSDPEVIRKSSGVVLPGVGAFADAMHNLRASGLGDAVLEILSQSKPFLGICLGLQLLFTESEEDGLHKGLGIIKGRVLRLPTEVKVPHMGWNRIKKVCEAPILQGISDGSYFYFVHSYYVDPKDSDIVCTTTEYGIEFTSSIWKDNIFAVQFHPEKSSKLGLKILKNFGGMVYAHLPRS